MHMSNVLLGGVLPIASIVANIGLLVRELFFPVSLMRDRAVLLPSPERPQIPLSGIGGWLNLYKTEISFIPDDELRDPILINMNEIKRVWCTINSNNQIEMQIKHRQGDVSGFKVRHAGSWAVAVIKRMNKGKAC